MQAGALVHNVQREVLLCTKEHPSRTDNIIIQNTGRRIKAEKHHTSSYMTYHQFLPQVVVNQYI